MHLLGRFDAWHVRRLRNVLFDLRSGHLLAGGSHTRHADKGAHNVVNTDVTALERIFADRIRPDDVLVDIGCGKGRVVTWWLRKGVGRRYIGLELDEEIANATGERLSAHSKVEIIAGDAIAQLPPDGTAFYMADPFAEPIVRAFNERAKELYGERGGVRIFYYNPTHVGVFRDDPAWGVEDVKIGPSDRFHDLCVIDMVSPSAGSRTRAA